MLTPKPVHAAIRQARWFNYQRLFGDTVSFRRLMGYEQTRYGVKPQWDYGYELPALIQSLSTREGDRATDDGVKARIVVKTVVEDAPPGKPDGVEDVLLVSCKSTSDPSLNGLYKVIRRDCSSWAICARYECERWEG